MKQGKVHSLEDRQAADATECERLRRRLYALADEWEPLMARQRELERQFVENDLQPKSGSRGAEPLRARGRQRRLAELLELNLRTHHLQSALSWTERRRVALLKKLNARGAPPC